MLTDLRLQNFRSYTDESFEFSAGVNIIVGPNASGKTNLLESILVLARGTSYRARDNELIQFNRSWARLDSHSEISGKRTVKLIAKPETTKTFEIDDKLFKRLSLERSLPIILFEPNHLQLVAGSPERRRDYIDDLLEQTKPGYGAIRRQYKRAVAQRNALLKQDHKTSNDQVFAWNLRLSQLGGVMVRSRQEIVTLINKDISTLYKQLSQTKNKLALTYQARWPIDGYETQFLKNLETNFVSDQQRGFTSSGPHREDVLISFDGHPAQEVASRGETRTAVLALKIIEVEVIGATRKITPMLLLDDVFSELDGKRRHALTDYLALHQTFITTTDADLVLQHFAENCNVIAVTN
jgi:DNA replication and repair protein RecF